VERTSPPPRPRKTPSYRRQRKKDGNDLAFVEIDGRRHYLGPYETPAGRERGYYVKHGKVTDEPENIALAVRPLLRLYGRTRAADFGPRALKAVRQAMVEKGWVRKHINRQVDRIKRMFKWAVAEELVPAGVYEGLRAVAGLKYGRCGAHDNPPVQPVPEDLIEPVKRHVSRQVAAMIDLQLLSGARPGEIVQIRPCDIDRTGPTWTYRPPEHKTEHHSSWGRRHRRS